MFLNEKMLKIFDRLREKKKAYQLTFGSPAGGKVLDDLMEFCHVNESCFDADPRIHAALEGRREVFLRIQQMMEIPSQHLFKLYYGQRTQNEDDHG
jgi:hypothetical protein